jgi:hypothetical protein
METAPTTIDRNDIRERVAEQYAEEMRRSNAGNIDGVERDARQKMEKLGTGVLDQQKASEAPYRPAAPEKNWDSPKQKEVKKQIQVVSKQVRDGMQGGIANRRVSKSLDPHTNAQAVVDGGEGTIEHNQNRIAELARSNPQQAQEVKKTLKLTDEHEKRHAIHQKRLNGNILRPTDNGDLKVFKPFGAYEGDAETGSQTALNRSETTKREGQPTDYAEAQTEFLELKKEMGAEGKEVLEQTLYGDGNVERVNQFLIEKSLEKQPDSVEQLSIKAKEEDQEDVFEEAVENRIEDTEDEEEVAVILQFSPKAEAKPLKKVS